MQVSTKVSERKASSGAGSPVAILSFSGDISSASKDAMLAAWHGISSETSKILLDFTAVDYINSSGIAIVIQMLLEAQKTGSQTVGIFGLSAHFQKVFTMVGINKYATLYRDEASALAAV